MAKTKSFRNKKYIKLMNGGMGGEGGRGLIRVGESDFFSKKLSGRDAYSGPKGTVIKEP